MNTNPNESKKKTFKLEEPFKYRIFLSYSHEDKLLVERIAEIIKLNGMEPKWDKNFKYGYGFHEQIKNFIEHAHVFLPVLTKTADARKWVHQEIGYAMALNIPVLPLAVGKLPREMIQQIHALKVDAENLDALEEPLSIKAISSVIESNASKLIAYYSCAPLPEDRAKLMSEYADDVYSLGICDVVRQKGALSSFHIPTEVTDNPVWMRRYGPFKQSEEHYRLQRKERFSLQRHVDSAGCKLIINPGLKYEKYGTDARICRLESLLKFLNEMEDDQCWIAIKDGMDPRISVTILGNWFAAESLAGFEGAGYRQTIFTRHAPTIIEKLSEFDAEFDELLKKAKVKKEDSRRWAIEMIENIIADISSEK
ncbi:MAG: toll/interleukin-1 receptor domain-containing protein [bacterium]